MNASIDIGTNTALLLVAEVNDGRLKVLYEDLCVPRLGKGVDKDKQLSDDAMSRVIDVLHQFQDIMARDFPEVNSITVTATSAVRDAQNRDEFLEKVSKQTGLQVQVLSGLEEANYTFSGALSVLDHSSNSGKVVIDIGGGSTEIAYGNRNVQDRYSFDMGCVRFTERFLWDDPPSDKQIENCQEAIQRTLDEYAFNFSDETTLIGVAGTVTSLAYMDQQLTEYKSKAISGHELSIDTLRDHINRIRKWSTGKTLEAYPVVMEGRADIFLAGLLILEEFMRQYRFENIVTSTGGIRHGSLLRQ